MGRKELECSCDMLELAYAESSSGLSLHHLAKFLLRQPCKQHGLDLDKYNQLELLLLCCEYVLHLPNSEMKLIWYYEKIQITT